MRYHFLSLTVKETFRKVSDRIYLSIMTSVAYSLLNEFIV